MRTAVGVEELMDPSISEFPPHWVPSEIGNVPPNYADRKRGNPQRGTSQGWGNKGEIRLTRLPTVVFKRDDRLSTPGSESASTQRTSPYKQYDLRKDDIVNVPLNSPAAFPETTFFAKVFLVPNCFLCFEPDFNFLYFISNSIKRRLILFFIISVKVYLVSHKNY